MYFASQECLLPPLLWAAVKVLKPQSRQNQLALFMLFFSQAELTRQFGSSGFVFLDFFYISFLQGPLPRYRACHKRPGFSLLLQWGNKVRTENVHLVYWYLKAQLSDKALDFPPVELRMSISPFYAPGIKSAIRIASLSPASVPIHCQSSPRKWVAEQKGFYAP